jgi:hypothetical protein
VTAGRTDYLTGSCKLSHKLHLPLNYSYPYTFSPFSPMVKVRPSGMVS